MTVTQSYIYAKSDNKRLMTSAMAITPEIIPILINSHTVFDVEILWK